MKLAMRIRVARQYAKMSQAELAVRLGVSRGAVANWECAVETQPTSARLRKLSLVTKASYEWLATGRGQMAYQADPNDVPAIDATLIEDPTERRLLRAFRENPIRIKLLILEMAESYVPKVRKAS